MLQTEQTGAGQDTGGQRGGEGVSAVPDTRVLFFVNFQVYRPDRTSGLDRPNKRSYELDTFAVVHSSGLQFLLNGSIAFICIPALAISSLFRDYFLTNIGNSHRQNHRLHLLPKTKQIMEPHHYTLK